MSFDIPASSLHFLTASLPVSGWLRLCHAAVVLLLINLLLLVVVLRLSLIIVHCDFFNSVELEF